MISFYPEESFKSDIQWESTLSFLSVTIFYVTALSYLISFLIIIKETLIMKIG